MGFTTGFGFGNHEDASFILGEKISLNKGTNTLDILSMMIGLQVSKIPFTSHGGLIYNTQIECGTCLNCITRKFRNRLSRNLSSTLMYFKNKLLNLMLSRIMGHGSI